MKSTVHLILPYMLLGMVVFIHGGSYEQDFVAEDGCDVHPFKDADFNAGIAVALPTQAILDLCIRAQRRGGDCAEIEEKKEAN